MMISRIQSQTKEVLLDVGGTAREKERAIKEETKATIRVIPLDENTAELKCIYSGKPARHEVLFAKAY